MSLKFEILKGSENYTAQVIKVGQINPHPNADKLKLTSVQGFVVIVGLDTQEGDTCLYFPLETALSEKFCTANDLYRRKDKNGKNVGGLFENHGRIRCQTLRGIASNGYVCDVKYLDNLGINSSKLKVGDEFNVINGIEICKKHVPKHQKIQQIPGLKKARKLRKSISKLIDGQFRLHRDTSQLGRNIHLFFPEDIVSITHKLHGCNSAFSNVVCKRKLNIFEKIFKFAGIKIQDTEYSNVFSSRSVVKNKELNPESKGGFYGSDDLWRNANERVKEFLEPGISIFCELVGQTPSGKWIQNNYSYGTQLGEFDLYVFRITSTNANGTVYEFGWTDIKHWCESKGIKHVPELYFGTAGDFLTSRGYSWLSIDGFRDVFLEVLKKEYHEKMRPEGVWEEGVCVRRENDPYKNAYKYKCLKFMGWETEQLDRGEVGIFDYEPVTDYGPGDGILYDGGLSFGENDE